MKKITLLSALINIAISVTVACKAPEPPYGSKRGGGLYTGKQTAQIQLTSGNNIDVAIPNNSPTALLRFLVNAANSNLTGLSAAPFQDGDIIFLRNDSATGLLNITNADATSLAANRFLTPGAVTLAIPPKGSVIVEYDGLVPGFVVELAAATNPSFLGNVTANGSAIPVQTSCGTSPAITAGSTDFSGTITTGSAATTCTATFATAFGVAPTCIVVNNTAATALVPTYATSTTALTMSVDVASTAYQYVCVGH